MNTKIICEREINGVAVSLRAPLVKDVRGLDMRDEMGFALDLACKCSNLSPQEFEQLEFAEAAELAREVSEYLTKK